MDRGSPEAGQVQSNQLPRQAERGPGQLVTPFPDQGRTGWAGRDEQGLLRR